MSKEVLNKHWQELQSKANVLNVALSTKFKNGVDTKIPSITVYVSKKVAAAELATEHLIPPEIEGVPTDVVEFAPTTWQADKTAISQLHPDEQLKRLGLIKAPPKKVLLAHRNLKTPSGQSDHIKWASAIRDQGNCGSCTGEGSIGAGEAVIRIKYNDMNACPLLSVAHLFFCSGGSCGMGNTVEAVLDQFMKGVCLESCFPYQPTNLPCPKCYADGICPNWWENAKKIAGWNTITDPTEILSLLDTVPLVATMAVHRSFINYVSGVYQNLGPSDPILGYHCICIFGYNAALAWKILRNSWGTGWAQGCVINGVARPGYCLIADGELDSEMYELIADGPVPSPLPAISSVSPNSGQQGATLDITVTGANFTGALLVSFGDKITVNNFSVSSDSQITTNITIAADAATGTRDVSVTNGWGVTTLPSAFTVKTPPQPSPCKISNGIIVSLNALARLAKSKRRFYYR